MFVICATRRGGLAQGTYVIVSFARATEQNQWTNGHLLTIPHSSPRIICPWHVPLSFLRRAQSTSSYPVTLLEGIYGLISEHTYRPAPVISVETHVSHRRLIAITVFFASYLCKNSRTSAGILDCGREFYSRKLCSFLVKVVRDLQDQQLPFHSSSTSV